MHEGWDDSRSPYYGQGCESDEGRPYMTDQADLEDKYSIVLADYATGEMREQIESDLISELLQEIPGNVSIEPEWTAGRLHTWDISDGDGIEGLLSTYQWQDGELDCSLTFVKFEKEDEKCQ